MIKGKWIILAVLLVAVVMGIATWPLLRLRRRHEVHKTEAAMESLLGSCEQYRARYGSYPGSLDFLSPQAPLEVLDAWRQPIQYELDAKSGKPRLWSRGPNPDDASDDIFMTRGH